jgi:hypothetical protein
MQRECHNVDDIAKIIYENYVKEGQYSITDRLSRVPSKTSIIEVLYDAIRGVKNDEDKRKFKSFVDSISNMQDTDAIYCAKLLALKALSRD